jgi:hypothetical protein
MEEDPENLTLDTLEQRAIKMEREKGDGKSGDFYQ